MGTNNSNIAKSLLAAFAALAAACSGEKQEPPQPPEQTPPKPAEPLPSIDDLKEKYKRNPDIIIGHKGTFVGGEIIDDETVDYRGNWQRKIRELERKGKNDEAELYREARRKAREEMVRDYKEPTPKELFTEEQLQRKIENIFGVSLQVRDGKYGREFVFRPIPNDNSSFEKTFDILRHIENEARKKGIERLFISGYRQIGNSPAVLQRTGDVKIFPGALGKTPEEQELFLDILRASAPKVKRIIHGNTPSPQIENTLQERAASGGRGR